MHNVVWMMVYDSMHTGSMHVNRMHVICDYVAVVILTMHMCTHTLTQRGGEG